MDGTVRTIESSASPDRVYAVAADFARYPEWTSAVRDVEVLEHDDEGRATRARFVVEAMVKRITYVLRYMYEDGAFGWEAEPGDDIKAMEGRYEFKPLDGGGTEIVYALKVEPAFSVPGFLRKQAEKQIVGAALRDLKREAEQAPA